jgi:hypothetical protein
MLKTSGESSPVSSDASRRRSASRLEHGADDLGRDSAALGLQLFLGGDLVLLQHQTRLLDLYVCFAAGLCGDCAPRLHRLLPPRFLALENCQASFPQALFVFRGSSFGSGDVSTRFFDCSFGFAAAFGQHLA